MADRRTDGSEPALAPAFEPGETGCVTDPSSEATRLLEHLPLAALVFHDGRLAEANPPARALFAGDPGATADLTTLVGDDVTAVAAEARDVGSVVDTEAAHGARELVARAVPVGPGRVVVLLTDTTETRRVEAMRRDFVTNASHELKTPAAGMQALAESIGVAIDRDPPRARQMVERLQHEATRLSTMVRELLDLARLEDAGGNTPQRIDLAATARQQVERFADLAERGRVTFDATQLHPAVVIAPPEDVRLLVANLVENAVRYNHQGGQVRLASSVEAGRAVLEVADTGIGIAEADQPRIFERFYRVDKARSRAAGGTGLGLSLVRHAAQRNGGRVTVRSALGRGSTFRVTLPVDTASAAAARSSEGDPAPASS